MSEAGLFVQSGNQGVEFGDIMIMKEGLNARTRPQDLPLFIRRLQEIVSDDE
jgi:hypothetical protein